MKRLVFLCGLVLACALASAGRAEAQRYLSVTFDDGWDVPENAWAMFDEAGITGTLYVNTQPLDERWAAYMNWGDVVRRHDLGWEIGSHTVSHAKLTGMWSEPMMEELLLSKLRILDIVGENPTSFSVPYGENDGRVFWYLERYYKSAVLAWGGYGMNTWIDPMRINRMNVTEKVGAGWICSKMREIPEGGWYVLMFHQVGLDGADYSCTLEQLRQIVGCIVAERDKGGLVVDTVSGVLERNRLEWRRAHVPHPDYYGP